MSFVLPNRKAFADYITRIFLKYRKEDRDPLDAEDKDADLCLKQSNAREMFPYQKLIRDYLMIETPYRGILLYHGLGSGKTCTSIAVAESLMSYKKVWVLTPASLQQNYRSELRKCGDPIYAFEQHWREKALNDQSRAEAKSLSISEGFLDRNGKFFVTVAGENPNYKDLPKTAQDIIKSQIEDIIGQRFNFINYNGLSSKNIDKFVMPPDAEGRFPENPFNNCVVIIDEVHNLISRIVNSSEIARRLYDAVYKATDCKIVGLSGTPVINRPNEIAYLMNLLRGPIERITIPFDKATSWDEEKMKTAFKALPDVDTIEFNAVKKYVLITRNPPHFRSVYNEAGDRIAVQYKKDIPFVPLAMDWVKTWNTKMTGEIGAEIAVDRVTSENLECLPTKFEEFANMFLDGLNIKNPLLFGKRIQGLVSYFKGADERLIPKRIEDDKMLEKVVMSPEQFVQYLDVRFQEIKADAKKALSMNDDGGSYRVISRLACNFAVPPELKKLTKEVEDGKTEETVQEKPEILAALKANPDKYLTAKALEIYSPKLGKMLANVEATRGDGAEWPNQFVYSQYRQLEGLGVFAAILDANGWQPYKITNKNGQWQEDEMADKPAYAFFSGEEKEDQRELMRQILNNRYENSFPPSLKTSIEKRGKKLLCMLMATASGAEGITLANVRHVHIMEPHWTPARHDQVIGRAIRICSHATLPLDQRTVKVSLYISVISPTQSKGAEGPNIVAVRKSDVELKRYEGDPAVETFMSTDEYLYEKVYEKDKVNQRISILLKQSAVDCEVHRKLHSREKPAISCMRFDTTATGEDLAFKPNIKSDDLDETYLRNMTRKKRRLQKLKIKDIVYFMDPDSKEIFDGQAFEDNQRLLRIGTKISETQIKYWLS